MSKKNKDVICSIKDIVNKEDKEEKIQREKVKRATWIFEALVCDDTAVRNA